MKDLTVIIECVFTLILSLITVFVIPYIKTKISAETFEEIIKWVKIAVQAAEMIYKDSGMGKEKKAYVVAFLKEKGIVFDEEKIDALIESAVLELKKEIPGESD